MKRSTGQKIVLAMIVRNESENIQRCLDSVIGTVDFIAITDTGSTDSTVQKIHDWSGLHPDILVKVNTLPFVNFEETRNANLQEAREQFGDQADYIMLLDADMCLQVQDKPFDKSALDQPVYNIKQCNSDLSYYNTRLIRLKDDTFKYKGVTHEYLDVGDNEVSCLISLVILDKNDGGCKQDKFIRDKHLLETALVDDNLSIHMRQRYTFYLAQTLMDSRKDDEALIMYQRRIDLGGWKEEVYISHLRRADILHRTGKRKEAFQEGWLATIVISKRAEAYYYILAFLNQQTLYNVAATLGALVVDVAKQQLLSETQQHLFQNDVILKYFVPIEYSIALYYTGQQTTFEDVTTRLIQQVKYEKQAASPLLKNVVNTLNTNRHFFTS